ncbi:L-glutamate gamma-semialdehyde dehydrogenase [Fervidobacterium sp.]
MYEATDWTVIPPFRNEPVTDFSNPENERKMKEALEKVYKEFGKEYDIVIGGKIYKTEKKIRSINPSKPEEVVGIASSANEELAEKALEAAWEAFKTWSRTPAHIRAEYLLKAAKRIRERKLEFDAVMVYEVGKNWVEADADTSEAIDFLEFYAREMLRYGSEQAIVRIPGEYNELRYIPLGVGIIIPPWNFPLAILVGMTSAAIVTGNTVVLKPASDSPVIAAKFFEVLQEIGLPDGVVNFLPGSGALAGEFLVKHPKTRFISFTGSKDVGLRIHELAAKPQPGQIWIKRTVLEMGGKDAVVVDETADLDAAAEGIVVSAFGFQGQKCSAGSRAVIVKDVYDKVIEKVLERTAKITIGDVRYKENWLGPVVNKSSMEKIMAYIEIGKKEGQLIYGGNAREDLGGYFIEPTIFKDVAWDARIAQEEIFGPVLAIIKAEDFDDALRIANATEYGLTGSLYSRDRKRIERAKEEFHVGNLYFNRKCTGALVGVHPFGGFNMSGTDSKAGGRDYLGLFLQAKAMSEKI